MSLHAKDTCTSLAKAYRVGGPRGLPGAKWPALLPKLQEPPVLRLAAKPSLHPKALLGHSLAFTTIFINRIAIPILFLITVYCLLLLLFPNSTVMTLSFSKGLGGAAWQTLSAKEPPQEHVELLQAPKVLSNSSGWLVGADGAAIASRQAFKKLFLHLYEMIQDDMIS